MQLHLAFVAVKVIKESDWFPIYGLHLFIIWQE